MAFEQFHILNPGKFIGILRDLHRVSIASVHNDLADIPAKDLRQKFQYILLLLFHRLCLISEDRHPAREKFPKEHILDPGIILHLINHDMLDAMMIFAAEKRIFQIKDRIDILITQLTLLQRNTRQWIVACLFKKTTVQNIAVSRLIHTQKTLRQLFLFFICEVSVPQCLHLIDEIFCHCLHSGKKRNIQELKVKQINDLLLGKRTALVLYVLEIHQFIFQAKHVSVHLTCKSCRLFLPAQFL